MSLVCYEIKPDDKHRKNSKSDGFGCLREILFKLKIGEICGMCSVTLYLFQNAVELSELQMTMYDKKDKKGRFSLKKFSLQCIKGAKCK